MAFNQNQYDHDIFQKLPFLGELFGYVYKNSKGDFKQGLCFRVMDVDYQKILQRLTGDSKSSITTGDKVYVLPNCKIPLFKLKEYFKATGAVQVNDVKDATKIIGHSNINVEGNLSSLLKSFNLYYTYSQLLNPENANNIRSYWKPDLKYVAMLTDYVKNNPYSMLAEQPSEVIIDSSFRVHLRGYPYEHNVIRTITPTCAIILYHQLQNKIPIVNEDAVFKAISKPLIIDADIYETLKTMLSSSDFANQTTAIELISNCDIDPSYYYLWQLAKNYINVMSGHSRNKNFRLFKEKISLYDLATLSEKGILPKLEEKGVLTDEIFLSLINEVVKTYKHKINHDLFDVVLKPSEKYSKYAPSLVYNFSEGKLVKTS